MTNTDNFNDELAFKTTSIIQQYLNKVKNSGKIKVTQLSLILIKKKKKKNMWKIKTKTNPPRSVTHHVWARVADSLEKIIINYFIKEHSD